MTQSAPDAVARELTQGLSKLGVSDAELHAKAQPFGLPEDILDRIGRRDPAPGCAGGDFGA